MNVASPLSRYARVAGVLSLSACAFPALSQEPAPAEGAAPESPAPRLAEPLRYEWSITTHEQVWGADPETPQTDRGSTATIVSSVDLAKPGVVVLTITAIEMSVPGTPMGDLAFDSETDPAEDGENMLAPPLRGVLDQPLEFRYNEQTKMIEGSPKLQQMPASRMLSGLLGQPFCTTALYPFFEKPGESTKTYSLVPGGAMARLTDLVVEFAPAAGQTEAGQPTLAGTFDGGVDRVLVGQLGPDGMSLSMKGDTLSVYTPGAVPSLATHRATTTAETSFSPQPNQPMRALTKMVVTAKQLPSD
jgi:hypothetical protein